TETGAIEDLFVIKIKMDESRNGRKRKRFHEFKHGTVKTRRIFKRFPVKGFWTEAVGHSRTGKALVVISHQNITAVNSVLSIREGEVFNVIEVIFAPVSGSYLTHIHEVESGGGRHIRNQIP